MTRERRKGASPEQFVQLAQATAGVVLFERTFATGEIKWYGDNSVVYGRRLQNLEEWLSVIHPEDRGRVQSLIEHAISEQAEYDTEYRVIWPDGSVQWIYGRGRVFFDEDGKPVRLIGAATNITRHKQATDALQATERVAMLGRALSSVMHELANPLQSIGESLYLLEQHPGLNHRGQELVSAARGELERATQIAHTTLDFSRPTPTEPVNLSETVDSVLQFYGRRMAEATIKVERRYKPVDTVLGNPGELRQLFGNIIRNAIEAADHDGGIKVYVHTAREYRSGCRGVSILIADSGKGVDPKLRRRVGQPFFTTKGKSGTGLGLWISGEIAKKHNASIKVRNASGKGGACFRVFFPFAASDTHGYDHPRVA